jgi:nicotinate-nucleotide adenylyltransferase
MKIPRLFYGGSFNPVHKGHLATIEYVLKEKICLEVLVVPNYQSPLKDKTEYASEEIRFEMLQYALRSYFEDDLFFKIQLLDVEIKEKNVNYTANTLKKIDNSVKMGILIGADSLETLHLWREIEWILTYYPFYVVPRANISLTKTQSQIHQLKGFYPMADFILLNFIPPNCSATEIRKKIKENAQYQELKDCLLPETYSLIKKYNLYY